MAFCMVSVVRACNSESGDDFPVLPGFDCLAQGVCHFAKLIVHRFPVPVRSHRDVGYGRRIMPVRIGNCILACICSPCKPFVKQAGGLTTVPLWGMNCYRKVPQFVLWGSVEGLKYFQTGLRSLWTAPFLESMARSGFRLAHEDGKGETER